MVAVQSYFRSLYHGASPRSQRFRIAMLVFDIATLIFFVATTLVPNPNVPWIQWVELGMAAIISFDVLIRWWIAPNRTRYLGALTTWVDVLVVITLVLPYFVESFVFLRVLRAVGLLRSFSVLRDLRSEYPFFRAHEELIQSAINLVVFIFVTSALVYVLQAHVTASEIRNFIDALYFTVATLTTTGFGDITLKGNWGHLLAVVIMIVGVALFLRLLQTIFRPTKVRRRCADCGLTRHEPDASHCKHCGRVIYIETEGEA